MTTYASSFRLLGSALAAGVLLLAARSAQAGAPWFQEDDLQFEPGACGGTNGCWTNYLRVTDLDGDGDLDTVFANYFGFFETGSAEPLAIYQNDGAGGFTNVSQTAVGGYSGRIREIAVGDVDGDGDLDIYAPDASGSGSAFFINQGSMTFEDEYSTRMPATEPRAGAARFFDADNDGDLDIFASDGFIANNPATFGHVYLNDGDGVFTELGGAIPGGFTGEDIDDVDIFDADRDFDLDIMVNAHSGNNALWLNDGTGTFAAGQLPAQPGGLHYGPSACDVDGDGDLDLWIENVLPNRTEQLLINDGTGSFTDETATRVTGNDEGEDDNGVRCVDIDNDGDFDGVVVSLGSPERLFLNDGSGNFAFVAGVFPGPTDSSLWAEFGDVNGDGRVDLVTGQGEGDTENKLYVGLPAVAVDTLAPKIIVQESVGEVSAGEPFSVRFAVSDQNVSDEGPRLRSAFSRATIGGRVDEQTALFSGGDVFRAEIVGQAEGNRVTLELCAEDWAGNEGCGDPIEYVVGAGSGTDTDTSTDSDTTGPTSGDATDSTDSGNDSLTTSTSGVSATASSTAPASDSNSGGSAAATDGGTDTDTSGQNDDSGCGCTTTERGSMPLFVFGLMGLVGIRRRRMCSTVGR